MAVDPASLMLYARLASEAADLVLQMSNAIENQRAGKKVTQADIKNIEDKRKRVDDMWARLAPKDNAPKPEPPKPAPPKEPAEVTGSGEV